MKKSKKWSILILLIVLQFVVTVYDAVFNESRIIKPINLNTYHFQGSDLPMMISISCLVLYVLYLVLGIFIGVKKKSKTAGKPNITRTLNPRYGWFGFFGFLGFIGIPYYMQQQQVWPFFFFTFFGFFGFFYEGKISNTLMDERFKEEQAKAQLISYRIGFTALWVVTWFMGIGGSRLNTDFVAIIFSVSSSLIIALVLFLQNYLLYKYDTEEVEV